MAEIGTAHVDLGNIRLTLPVYVKLNGEYVEVGTITVGSGEPFNLDDLFAKPFTQLSADELHQQNQSLLNMVHGND